MPTWTGISGTQHDARDHTAIVDPIVDAAIAALVDTAPGALDTLNELAAALGDDANFAATVTTALAGKADTGHTHGGGTAAVARGRMKTASTTYMTVPGRDVGNQNTIALGVNLLTYEPWLVHTPITIDQIVTEVTVAASAGLLIRLGIYNADIDWMPTSLVLDAGTVAADSTGVKAVSISQALPVGRYLAAIISNGTPTVRGLRSGGEFGVSLSGTANISTLYKTMGSFDPLAATGVAPDTVTLAAGTNTFVHRVFARVSVP